MPVGPFGSWLLATPPASGLVGRVHAAIALDAAAGTFRNVTCDEELTEWLSVVDLTPDEQAAVKSLFATAIRRTPF